jgi:hypothetical protein
LAIHDDGLHSRLTLQYQQGRGWEAAGSHLNARLRTRRRTEKGKRVRRLREGVAAYSSKEFITTKMPSL